MTKALTLRLDDSVHEALRKEAFDNRVPISFIVRGAIDAHLAKRTRTSWRDCDWNGCEEAPTGVTTPGGFHFCDEHMPVKR